MPKAKVAVTTYGKAGQHALRSDCNLLQRFTKKMLCLRQRPNYLRRGKAGVLSELAPARASLACLSPISSLYSFGSTLSIGMTTMAKMAKPAAEAPVLVNSAYTAHCACHAAVFKPNTAMGHSTHHRE